MAEVRKEAGKRAEDIEALIQELTEIDKTLKPSPKEFSKNYKKAQEKYRKWCIKCRSKAEQTMKKFKISEEISIEYGHSLCTKYRNEVRKHLQVIDPKFQGYHLPKAKEQFPEYKETLKKISSDVDTGRKIIRDILQKDDFPDELKSFFRKKGVSIEHPIIRSLHLNKDLGTKRNEISNKNLVKKHSNILEINQALPLFIANKILSDPNSDHFDLIIAIALSTGRRLIEIIKTGRFRKAKDNKIIFSGQAKLGLADDKPYQIFCLQDTDVTLKAIKSVRSQMNIKDKTNTEISNAISSTLNSRIRKIFDLLDIQFKYTRQIYAHIAYNQFGDKYTKSKSKFIADLMGHSEHDIITVKSYTYIKVKKSKTTWEDLLSKDMKENEKAEQNLNEISNKVIRHLMSCKENMKGAAEARAFEFILTQLKENQRLEMSKTWISRQASINKGVIERVFKRIGFNGKKWKCLS